MSPEEDYSTVVETFAVDVKIEIAQIMLMFSWVLSLIDAFSRVFEVSACLSSYYELRPCRPRLEKLKQLLEECPYRGPEYEEGLGLGEDETEEEEGGQPKRRKRPRKVRDPVLITHWHFVTCNPSSLRSLICNLVPRP